MNSPPTNPAPTTNAAPPKPTPAGLSPNDAAAFIGMARSTLDAYVLAGFVPQPAKVGGKCIYCRAKLEVWLAYNCPAAAEFETIWRRRLAGK